MFSYYYNNIKKIIHGFVTWNKNVQWYALLKTSLEVIFEDIVYQRNKKLNIFYINCKL